METAPSRFVYVDTNPQCDASIAKLLLVFDQRGSYLDDMLDFLTRTLGYHVYTLQVDEAQFRDGAEFIHAFDGFVPRDARDRQFVFYVFQFSSQKKTACLFCDAIKTDSSRLLKAALATCYVRYGTSRCAIVHPEHCCTMDDTLPPLAPIEDMQVAFRPNGSSYMKFPCVNEHAPVHATVQSVLTQKIQTIRNLDARKESARHVVTVQEEEKVKVEQPISEEDLLRKLQGLTPATDIAHGLGVSPFEWESILARSYHDALYLVVRRAKRLQSPEAVCEVFEVVAGPEVADVVRRSFAGEPIYVSQTPLLQGPPSRKPTERDEAVERELERKREEAEMFKPSEGTHVEKVNTKFLPPFMREQLEKERTITEESLGADPGEGIKRLQEIDKAYEKMKLERELAEYHGQNKGAPTLMGGYSMRDAMYGAAAANKITK